MKSDQKNSISDVISGLPSKQRLEIPKGDFLFKEGEPGPSLFYLYKGELGILRKQWVIWLAQPSDLIGLSSFFIKPSGYLFSAKAVSDCQVYCIEAGEFEELLLNNPAFSREIMKMLCQRIHLTNQKTKSLRTLSTRSRIIREIISHAKALKTNHIPYGIDDLSEFVGISVRLIRSTVKELEHKKLLQRVKNGIIIRDLKGLEVVAACN